MTAIASLPTMQVEVSFTAPYATPSWVDITTYVKGFDTQGGRQHELDQIEPSTATIVLSNRDARFNPWNTTGPYASMGVGLVPEMPVKITATWNSVTYPIFYGYVDSWIPSWSNPMSGDITISASDILGLFAVNNMNLPYYKSLVLASTPTFYYRCDEPPGSSLILDSSGNSLYAKLIGTPNEYQVPGALTTDIDTGIDLDGDAYILIPFDIPSTAGMTFELWFKTDSSFLYNTAILIEPQVAAIGASYFEIAVNTTGGGSNLYMNVNDGTTNLAVNGPVIPTDGNWHHLVVTATANFASVIMYLDGVSVGTGSSAGVFPTFTTPLQIGWTGAAPFAAFVGQVDEVAFYPSVLSGATVLAHYQAGAFADAVQFSGQLISGICTQLGVPTGLLSIATGVSEVQPLQSGATLSVTEVLDFMQQVNGTENGLLWQAPNGVLTFVDRHTALTQATSRVSQATFEDAPTSTYFYLIDGFVPGLDNLDLWNEVIAAAQQDTTLGVSGANQVYENLASQTQYGKRTYPNSPTLLTVTDAEALEFAQYIGGRYSTPVARVRTVQLSSNAGPSGTPGVNLPAMLGLSLWERVTIISHGLVGGTALTQIGIIEGVQHSFKADPGEWRTIFQLSPADTTSWFILNDAVYGTLTEGNKLAY